MKKSPLGDYAYLAHMHDAIKTIKSYTRPGEGAFFKSQLLQDGVCRQLGIMGEAANKVSAVTRKKLDGMPWNEVIGNRNFLIHAYFAVSLPMVWKNATQLVSEVEAVLDKHKTTIALLKHRAKEPRRQ